MSNTKVCPACHKELPVLAVRCKYCGFKQPLARDDNDDAENEGVPISNLATGRRSSVGAARPISTIPPAKNPSLGPQKRRQIISAAPSSERRLTSIKDKATSMPPDATTGKNRKKTQSIHTGLKSLAKDALDSTKARDGARKDKKNLFSSPDIAPEKKVGSAFGDSSGKFGDGGRKSTVLMHAPKFAGAKSKKAEPVDTAKRSGDAAASMGDKPDTSSAKVSGTSIPEQLAVKSQAAEPSIRILSSDLKKGSEDSLILSLDDDSQLVLLNDGDEGTEELDLDNLPPDDGINEPDVEGDAEDSVTVSKDDGKPPVSKAQHASIGSGIRRLFAGSVPALKRVLMSLASIWGRFQSIVRKAPLKVWLIIGSVTLVGGVSAMLVNSCDAPKQAGPSSDAQIAKSEADDAKGAVGANQNRKPKEMAPAQTKMTQSNRKCGLLDSYGPFLWKSDINKLLKQSNTTAICQLMGHSVQAMKKLIAGREGAFYPGVDGLPESSALFFVPDDEVDAGGRGIELIFYRDQLFRILLDYGADRNIEFEFNILEESLDVETVRETDGDVAVSRIDDGDLRTELVTIRDGQLNRQLTFTDLKIQVALKERVASLRKAQQLAEKGERLLAQKQFGSAVDAFQLAIEANDAFGRALAGRAMAQAFMEDYTGAQAAAERVTEVTKDTRVIAQARQVLSIVALRNGDVKSAISHLAKAVELDPQNSDAVRSQKELETGKYSTERVALTAARMSCAGKLGATPAGLLAVGNFPDTQTFFDAMKAAKQDILFERLKRGWVSRECR
ncbi:MAG: hypothetical protein JXR76_05540 [Deltaproteobacteria bacterium]|nr:hypothetical protein [Deltaproteobacteria bacterium]